jgi:glycosyltransferase involved in cell wall biosynthesis
MGVLMPCKLLYLVSEDWYFLSHRLPMARAAKQAGYEVHVATRVADGAEQIQNEGFVLHPMDWRRGSTNPLHIATTVAEVRKLYRRLRPDIVHHVAFVPAIIGSIAALGLPIARLNAIAGLGFVFTSNTTKARLLRPFVRRLLSFLFARARTLVLVQNPDDKALMMQLGLAENSITLIRGSGVDVDQLTPLPEPQAPFTVGFVGRLLYDKGVETLVLAQEILVKRGVQVRCLLAGTPDASNPATVPEKTLARWREHENLSLMGYVDDIRKVWAQSHVAALPSRREGLPKSLLEAAACGRPLIATDVPGCREIVRPEVTGLLVAPDNPAALADAMERLMKDRSFRLRLGAAARQIVVAEFSSASVGAQIVKLYARLSANSSAAQLLANKTT